MTVKILAHNPAHDSSHHQTPLWWESQEWKRDRLSKDCVL